MINRAKLRGKPLDKDCYRGKTFSQNYGEKDDIVFCYGLIDLETDGPCIKCKKCKAWVQNNWY